MDLSQLSTEDLKALKAGDLTKVSTDGLKLLKAGSPAPAAAPSASDQLLGGLGHGMGNVARDAVNAVTGIPGMLSNVTTVPLLNAAISPFTDKRFGNQNQLVNENLTKMGVAEPNGPGERIVNDALTATMGAGGVAKLAENIPGKIAELFARNPGTQMLSAGTGATAGGATREAGGGPVAQTIASLLGSLGVAPAAQWASGGVKNLLEPYLSGGPDDIKARLLNSLTEGRRQNVIDALGRAPVPGSQATAAEKAIPAGSTELSGLQSLLAGKYDPSGYRDLGLQQAANGTADPIRAQISAEMAKQGAPRAAGLIRQNFEVGQGALPPMLERKVMVLRALMNRATGTATDKVLPALTQDMKDPAIIRQLLLRGGAGPDLPIMDRIKLLLAGQTQVDPQINGGQ